MLKCKNIVEAVLEERGLSLQKTINNLNIDSPICSCFITAYQDGFDKQINEQRNEKLELNLHTLSYRGYKKTIGGYKYKDGTLHSEPGFLVSCNSKNIDPEEFKEEMLALGKIYGQESILIKLPGIKPGYYGTESKNFGKVIDTFNSYQKINPKKHFDNYPKDEDAWKLGYTQLQKDKNKHKDQGFELKDIEKLNLESLYLDDEKLAENAGSHMFSSSSGHLTHANLREKLGLSPFFKKNK